MYTPYTFLFSSMVEKKQDVKGVLPNWPSYLIQHADSIKHFEFKNNKGEMLSQKLNHYPFYIDLIQSKSSHPLKFDFEIHQEQLFMCFMIAGDLEFWEPSLGKINQTKEMYYYSNALDFEKDVFELIDPVKMAEPLKYSAEKTTLPIMQMD